MVDDCGMCDGVHNCAFEGVLTLRTTPAVPPSPRIAGLRRALLDAAASIESDVCAALGRAPDMCSTVSAEAVAVPLGEQEQVCSASSVLHSNQEALGGCRDLAAVSPGGIAKREKPRAKAPKH